MREITLRELRKQGGKVLRQVACGEAFTVTRRRQPIAELRPVGRTPLPAALLLNRWRPLPAVDPAEFRTDVDDLFETAL